MSWELCDRLPRQVVRSSGLCVQASCMCKCVVRRLVVCARGLYVKVGCGCRCVVCLGGVCVCR
jgi:hypothetical protein